MPIRSPRGRSAAYRGLWEWPLRSPFRLAVTLAGVLAVAVGVSLGATAAGAGGSGGVGLVPLSPPGSTSGTAQPSLTRGTASDAPGPTVLAPVPELEPTTLPLSQAPAQALDVASQWTAAWVRPPDGVTAEQWLEGLRPTTTEEYFGVLGTVDPANNPSTRVTGSPRPLRVSPSSVEVQVPTDAATLVVLVVVTEAGWRVSDYDRV